MYFLVKGKAQFVHQFMNQKRTYHDIEKGSSFGHADLFGRRQLNESLLPTKKNKKDLVRSFTCIAVCNKTKFIQTTSCELLTISIADLERMRLEFVDIYESLYKSGQLEAINILRKKKMMINDCVKEKNKQQLGEAARLFAKQEESDIDEDFIKQHIGRIPDEFYQGMTKEQKMLR